MPVDANFIQKILELAPPEFVEDDNGRKLCDKKLFPLLKPEAEVVVCHTLTGLVDFYPTIEPEPSAPIVLVEDYNKVSLVSGLFGVEKQREWFITANAYAQSNVFDRYFNHEDFMINILSMFVQDETTSKILKIVGNLKAEAGATYSDDGLSQTVTAKTGITKVESIELPNPIVLRPYRTFMDITQPESSFILRMKQDRDGISVALFQADGSAWKNKAIANIKEYFKEHLPAALVVA